MRFETDGKTKLMKVRYDCGCETDIICVELILI